MATLPAMTEQRERGSSVSVLATMGVVAALAVIVMVVWHRWHVEPWAARSSQHSYSAPGAFGDSFAPVVGFMTALALGAAIASVLMQRRELELQREEMQLQRDEMKAQREEMGEARKQWTAQAASMAEANKHAERANELAYSAQLLEVAGQIADLDAQAVAAVETVKERNQRTTFLDGQRPNPIGDAGALWFNYARSSRTMRPQNFPEIDSAHMQALAVRRGELEMIQGLLRAGKVRSPDKEQLFVNVAEET